MPPAKRSEARIETSLAYFQQKLPYIELREFAIDTISYHELTRIRAEVVVSKNLMRYRTTFLKS